MCRCWWWVLDRCGWIDLILVDGLGAVCLGDGPFHSFHDSPLTLLHNLKSDMLHGT